MIRETGPERKRWTPSEDDVKDFESRLQNLDISVRTEADHVSVEEKSYDQVADASRDQMSQLTEALAQTRGAVREKSSSPLFRGEAGNEKRWKQFETETLFFELLKSKEWPPAAIHGIIDQHIAPVSQRISDLNKELQSLTTTEQAEVSDDPFAPVQKSKKIEQKSRDIQFLIRDLTAQRLRLMREIIHNPEQFGVDKRDFKKGYADLKISITEFKDRLENAPIAEVFLESGRRMVSEEKAELCKKTLNNVYKGEKHQSARRLFFSKCIIPIINQMRTVSELSAISPAEKNRQMSILDTKLAHFMRDVISEDGYKAYGHLIVSGVPPTPEEGKEDYVDFPKLRLRPPVKLQDEMKLARPEDRKQLQFNFYEELTKNYEEDKRQKIKTLYQAAQFKRREEIFYDEAGRKQILHVLAEMKVLLTEGEGAMTEEDFAVSYEHLIRPIFGEMVQLQGGLRELRQKGGSDIEIRAKLVLLRQKDEELIRKVSELMDVSLREVELLGLDPEVLAIEDKSEGERGGFWLPEEAAAEVQDESVAEQEPDPQEVVNNIIFDRNDSVEKLTKEMGGLDHLRQSEEFNQKLLRFDNATETYRDILMVENFDELKSEYDEAFNDLTEYLINLRS